MNHYKVRRISTGGRLGGNDTWPDQMRWISGDEIRKIVEFIPRLIRWCGMASVIGGVLFMATLFCIGSSWFGLVEYADIRPLAAPMVLYLVGLAGLYLHVKLAGKSGRLGNLGLFLSFVGLILAIALTTGWLNFPLEGFDDPYHSFWFEWVVWESRSLEWYVTASLGLILVTIGMILFGIAAIRAKVLPTWGLIFLIVSSLPMHMVPSIVVWLIVNFDPDHYGLFEGLADVLYYWGGLGAYSILLALFAAGWIWLGYALWSGRSTRFVS